MFFFVMWLFNVIELFYIGCLYKLYFVVEKNWNICGSWKRDDVYKLNEL